LPLITLSGMQANLQAALVSTDDWAAYLSQPAAQVVPLRPDQSAWTGR
jgi:hypothetical protein